MSEALRKVLRPLTEFFQWLMAPVRALIRGLMVLVNLTPRQMQSFCTLSMIGGVMANSFWIYLYVTKVESATRDGVPFDSPFYELAIDAVKWLSIMSGGFALFMCLIAFGADWLRLKYKDLELGAGNGDEE